ncbi:MAG: hypothetical protein K2N12_08680, partial [Helicobacter sp.]|nr:hypothetical protein [Helicobacter sp.]
MPSVSTIVAFTNSVLSALYISIYCPYVLLTFLLAELDTHDDSIILLFAILIVPLCITPFKPISAGIAFIGSFGTSIFAFALSDSFAFKLPLGLSVSFPSQLRLKSGTSDFSLLVILMVVVSVFSMSWGLYS